MPYSQLASPSATISVLKEHGLYTRKSLGQHLLVDDNVVGRIISLARLSGAEHVVEVGPGIGTLTLALADSARSVVAVEKDPRFAHVLATMAARRGNVRIVEADALDVDSSDVLGPAGELPSALVANLPYSIAATIVLSFFESIPSIDSATVMVQSEVADRMAACVGTKDYGAYSVKLALYATVVDRFSVSRGCFLPPPRVDSSVVRLERVRSLLPRADIERARRAAEGAFSQRRKTLRNAIAGSLGVSPAQVEAALRSVAVDPSSRAESHSPKTYVTLGQALHRFGLLP
ncbi:MAG: 16S rRNA (adenine(1518)-N(6)/adenine(1519)-N(6))-dimethyltransferase RsmA [Coriobacteriales bacterium]|nr:16S rRNA (adenine(1518)-N(6)/adenine(1519)-N(6))-dimethyltransferase RsmA [Actinomycetes bacterium]